MSTTIDNRIVEMKFNNKQFESGAKTTLNTLDKLKASLNFDAAAQSLQRGFSGIERSLALDGIAQGVDTISTRFSALGVVGATVLSNLTTQAMGLISRLNSLVVNPIIEGGKTRAQNIEHAKFQLEGLKVAWEDIEPDISYGVQDTAYGLDAAATVASQLVASNVQLGDSMKAALRGVSGVAAMTSSSYEEIGHIFTTVAGQGRLMGMQLTQLSMRGINAAATLGSALHKTEAEIRDMVSKGQIDFETFAKAMDEAYGLHATAANKTFTGALSNTRAALSRIGAKFATPAYDDLKDALNGLIPVINGVNKSLDPFVDMMSKEMKNASATVVGILAKIDENKIKTLSSIISDSVVILQNTKDLIISLVKPINQAFRETFPDSALTRLSEFTLKLSEVSKSFKASDERLNKLKNTFKGLFSIVSLLGTVVKSVISSVTPYANAVSNLFDPVLDRLSSFGSGISAFQKSTSGNNAFFENLNEILNYIRISLERVSPKLRAFKEAVQSFISPFQTSFNSEKLLSVFRFFTTGLTEDQAEKAMVFSKILARIAEVAVNVGTAIAKAASSVSGAVQEMFPDAGLSFGIAALAVGAGLAALSIGIGLLAGVATSLVDTIISLGMALLIGIEVLSSKIIEVAFVIVTKLVVALARYLPIIVESGVMLILGLLKGIESHLGDIILVVGEILVVLIYGLGAIAPTLASSRLTDGIEVDPVIRPVVDFSDVANGVAAINGLMSNRSISLGEISGVFSANSTVSFSGAVSELKNVGARNANQINQSLSELRADVSMLREAISKMRIVMDSGALVGEIIDPLDQALGRRIVMKGRGV